MNQNNRAFTLIELLVVVLIIGILSAIALPQYEAAVEKSRAAEMWPILKHAEQMYEVQWLADPANVNSVKPQDIMELNNGTWSSDGKKYCTKYFRYSFDTKSTTVERCTPKSDCSVCSSNNFYDFYVRTPRHEDYDEAAPCWYRNTLGKKVCKSFAGLIPVTPVLDD